MALIKSLVLFSMFCSVFSTTDKIIPIGPTATAGPMPPTASVPTLPPVTPPPTNTTSTSTTTTTPKTTSTVTTTTKTTTPTPTTTTTKSTPTTTTTKPTTTATTTTTVKPTPPVPPTQGTWVANYTNTNNTCLILQAALQIDVAYMDGNATKMYPVNVPVTAQSDGKCGNDTENITLSWNYQNTISFYFKKNHSKFDLHSIVTMVNVTLPGSNGTQIFVLAHNAEEFPTPVSNSYKCSEKVLNLTSAAQSSNATGQLHITHLQFQAFRNSTSRKFDEALDCAGSETPDVVPIAVGCALAALVIVVLIAYLIGRRRSQARGYLSM